MPRPRGCLVGDLRSDTYLTIPGQTRTDLYWNDFLWPSVPLTEWLPLWVAVRISFWRGTAVQIAGDLCTPDERLAWLAAARFCRWRRAAAMRPVRACACGGARMSRVCRVIGEPSCPLGGLPLICRASMAVRSW